MLARASSGAGGAAHSRSSCSSGSSAGSSWPPRPGPNAARRRSTGSSATAARPTPRSHVNDPTPAQLRAFRRVPEVADVAVLHAYGLTPPRPAQPQDRRDHRRPARAHRSTEPGSSRAASPTLEPSNEIAIGEGLAREPAPRHRRPSRRRLDHAGAARAGRQEPGPGPDAGPRVRLRIVGIVRRPLDLGDLAASGGVVIETPAFDRAYRGPDRALRDGPAGASPTTGPRTSRRSRRGAPDLRPSCRVRGGRLRRDARWRGRDQRPDPGAVGLRRCRGGRRRGRRSRSSCRATSRTRNGTRRRSRRSVSPDADASRPSGCGCCSSRSAGPVVATGHRDRASRRGSRSASPAGPSRTPGVRIDGLGARRSASSASPRSSCWSALLAAFRATRLPATAAVAERRARARLTLVGARGQGRSAPDGHERPAHGARTGPGPQRAARPLGRPRRGLRRRRADRRARVRGQPRPSRRDPAALRLDVGLQGAGRHVHDELRRERLRPRRTSPGVAAVAGGLLRAASRSTAGRRRAGASPRCAARSGPRSSPAVRRVDRPRSRSAPRRCTRSASTSATRCASAVRRRRRPTRSSARSSCRRCRSARSSRSPTVPRHGNGGGGG